MYGLFKITFDGYVFEELVCVSKSKEKLEDYYTNSTMGDIDRRYVLVDNKESEKNICQKIDINHYVIIKVIVI